MENINGQNEFFQEGQTSNDKGTRSKADSFDNNYLGSSLIKQQLDSNSKGKITTPERRGSSMSEELKIKE